MECYEEEEQQKNPQRNTVVNRSKEFEMNKTVETPGAVVLQKIHEKTWMIKHHRKSERR